MNFHLRRGLSFFCIVIAFVLIATECSILNDWTSTVAIVAEGVGFYTLTFWSMKGKPRWVVGLLILVLMFWSLQVYAIFVAGAMLAMSAHPHEFSNVPVWANDAAPYVFACTPFIILGGARIAFPTQK